METAENKAPGNGAVEAAVQAGADELATRLKAIKVEARSPAIAWGDLDDAAKLERLRYVVKQIDRRLARVAELEQAIGQLLRHTHGAQGELLTPLQVRPDAMHRGEPDDTAGVWF